MLAAAVCSPSSAFFGFMGATASIVFSNLGSAYGTAKAGVGVASMGVMRPDLVMRSVIPVIMAGVLGIYGLIISVIMIGDIGANASTYSDFYGFCHLCIGLSVGLSCLSAGLAIGISGDAGVRANAQQTRLFVGVVLILIFGEAIALYGLIVGLVGNSACKNGAGLCTAFNK
eukprot:GHVR01123223.1.p1 GENE.GHVR01123223.1~~GHVR01123223.1.p1  ORF type:complete len:172 (+),score=21.40 GHVR01123223.1:30-545(+)